MVHCTGAWSAKLYSPLGQGLELLNSIVAKCKDAVEAARLWSSLAVLSRRSDGVIRGQSVPHVFLAGASAAKLWLGDQAAKELHAGVVACGWGA